MVRDAHPPGSCGTATTARQSPTLATQIRCTRLGSSALCSTCPLLPPLPLPLPLPLVLVVVSVQMSATTAAVPVIASPTGLPFTYLRRPPYVRKG